MNRWCSRLFVPICLVLLCTCSDDDGNGGSLPCPSSCGPNATCTVDNVCACVQGWKDCNGDLGQQVTDGCECSRDCDGNVCSTGTPECTPTLLNACGDAAMYCNVDTCVPCPQGKYNCDGTQDCESDEPCAVPGQCEQFGENTCGSQSQYCDDNGQCQPCPEGTYNCSQSGGDCECTTGCDGTFCIDECTSQTGCNDPSMYCDFGTCTPCPEGTYNCNGRDECECSEGCDGSACKGATACDYSDQNVCGGDTSKWCYQNECVSCSDGFYNCNNTMGCECDAAGCDGTQCAGQCTGGEC
jgi:hypothetical protein